MCSGSEKLVNMVDGMNKFSPATVAILAFEWVHLIKSNLLFERLVNPEKIKESLLLINKTR